MFLFILFLLSIAKISTGLECITDCTIFSIPFGQSFQIGDGQCQQRISKDSCGINLYFFYDTRIYTVDFSKYSITSDSFQIADNQFVYTIGYQCSDETNCVVSYAQHRIRDMTSRSYAFELIWSEIAPYLTSSSQVNSVQCYNTDNQPVECSSGYCNWDYEIIHNRIQSRGCKDDPWLSEQSQVFFVDLGDSTFLDITCHHSFCNNMTTYTKIKDTLVRYGLIDANGRRIALAIKETASQALVAFTLMFVIVFISL